MRPPELVEAVGVAGERGAGARRSARRAPRWRAMQHAGGHFGLDETGLGEQPFQPRGVRCGELARRGQARSSRERGRHRRRAGGASRPEHDRGDEPAIHAGLRRRVDAERLGGVPAEALHQLASRPVPSQRPPLRRVCSLRPESQARAGRNCARSALRARIRGVARRRPPPSAKGRSMPRAYSITTESHREGNATVSAATSTRFDVGNVVQLDELELRRDRAERRPPAHPRGLRRAQRRPRRPRRHGEHRRAARRQDLSRATPPSAR